MSLKSLFALALLVVSLALSQHFVQAQDKFLGKNVQAWLTDLDKGSDQRPPRGCVRPGQTGGGGGPEPAAKTAGQRQGRLGARGGGVRFG